MIADFRGDEGLRIRGDDISPTIVAHGSGGPGLNSIPSLIELTSQKAQGGRVYSPEGLAVTLSSQGGGQGAKTGLYAFSDARIRRLTPVECERLQGFPDGWTEWGIDEKGNRMEISDTQRYKCLGNAVSTNVIARIISGWKELQEPNP